VIAAGAPRVEYIAPGEREPVYLTRRKTIYDVVFVDGKPYTIHLCRSKTGKLFLRARPLFGYSEEVANYVREKIEECPWLHARGEEYRRIVREYGMPPTALCIKMIMEGRRFGRKEMRRRPTMADIIIGQLVAGAEKAAGRQGPAAAAAPAALASPPSLAAPAVEGILALWRGGGRRGAGALEELLKLWRGR
jgi:hypothetical protein